MSASPTSRPGFQSHGRTMSTVSAATDNSNPRGSRMSMQFPIQSVTEPEREVTTSPLQEMVPEAVAPPTGPTDNNFLTAIAAQERKVLELKEELQRAEEDLSKLKKQWVNHEAQKKRNDARKVAKLQPLNTKTSLSPGVSSSIGSVDNDEDGSNAWLQHEMERRKALMQGSRSSGRTVFSGSRHTRALSLLSPTTADSPTALAQRPQRQDSLRNRPVQEGTAPPLRPQLISRSSTTPDLTNAVAESADADINLSSPNAIDREMLIKTGKKMATGFRDGLWTFIEDLRQATVGDEAAQTLGPSGVAPAGLHRQSSNQTLRAARRQASKMSLRAGAPGSRTAKSPVAGRAGLGESLESRPLNDATQALEQDAPEHTPLVDVDGTFWHEHSLASTPQRKTPVTRHAKTHSKASAASSNTASVDDSAWDVWPDSSPAPSALESRSSSVASNAISTPRTSASSTVGNGQDPSDRKRDSKRDSIPWPTISKMGPAQLKRTASHLMSEWEKSLTPSPGEEWNGEQGDFLGMGAEAAATASSARKDH
ncbi:hypothetical protein K431DRAFT_322068 [Polychaeton citri CBS 116435]|uniref:DUF4048 domain-containing protein n=1 Tax=Polychaeton citri CBS 116435 TaxID=1314669 RepID=A0A9P4Q3V4_9PEZI|nr:hypothetical protein K431DRAFT_322068 [Polychaeton citri CBS 116435]